MKLGTVQEREKSLKEELNRIVAVIQDAYDPEKIVFFDRKLFRPACYHAQQAV